MTNPLVLKGLHDIGPCGDARLLTIIIDNGRIDIRNTLSSEPESTNRPLFGYEKVPQRVMTAGVQRHRI